MLLQVVVLSCFSVMDCTEAPKERQSEKKKPLGEKTTKMFEEKNTSIIFEAFQEISLKFDQYDVNSFLEHLYSQKLFNLQWQMGNWIKPKSC